jgi:hypothetical protein
MIERPFDTLTIVFDDGSEIGPVPIPTFAYGTHDLLRGIDLHKILTKERLKDIMDDRLLVLEKERNNPIVKRERPDFNVPDYEN